MKKKKVGIDIQSTYGQITGLGVYTKHLLEGVTKLTDKYEFIPIDSSLQKDNMRTPLRFLYDQGEKMIKGYLENLDLFHIPAFSAPFLYLKKKIVTCHDIIPILYPPQSSRIARIYWVTVIYESIRGCDYVIVNSETTKRDIMSQLHIPAEKIKVVYLGVSEDIRPKSVYDSKTIAQFKEKYHLPDAYALYLGTIEPRKNVQTLIDAMHGISLPLVLCGKIAPGFSIQSNEQVLQFGYIPEEDKRLFYALATVFVMPSVYEGFCFPIVEAMRAGTPVVASSASCIPEIGGDACLYCDPHSVTDMREKIQTMLSKRDLAQEYIQKGFLNAQRFSWEKMCRETLEVYDFIFS